jgi:hypothetical protein
MFKYQHTNLEDFINFDPNEIKEDIEIWKWPRLVSYTPPESMLTDTGLYLLTY